MGKQPSSQKAGLKRGPWTMEEDSKLVDFILYNGVQCWRLVPKRAGLLRCGKSCRLRWLNYLRPDLKRGGFTQADEDIIIQLHSRLGNRWSKIAAHLPGRTDNEIKNHWNTRIRKRLIHQNSAAETNQKLGFQEIAAPCGDDHTDVAQDKTQGETSSSSQDRDESLTKNVEMEAALMQTFCMDSWQNWMDEPSVWDGF